VFDQTNTNGVNSAIILGDSTTELKFYYNRTLHTVTWKNEDGTVLLTQTNVKFGQTPTYSGVTPTKDSTKEESYAFSGWSPQVIATTGDTSYLAVFKAEPINNLTWLFIVLGILLLSIIGLIIFVLFFYKATITFILNGKEVAKLKFKFNEKIEYPLNLARYKWFADKEQTTLFAKQKMGLKSITLYRETETKKPSKTNKK